MCSSLEELINYKWDSEEIMKYKLKFKYEKLELKIFK